LSHKSQTLKKKSFTMIAPETIRAATAEFCAMILFVFIGCGTAVSSQMRQWAVTEAGAPGQAGDAHVAISLAFGIGIAVLAYCIAPLSGGHINPAVTLSFVIQRKMTWVEASCYWLAQLLGAIFGAAILWGCSYNPE
jgi:glycerol uptake facilitator-like aquaporin